MSSYRRSPAPLDPALTESRAATRRAQAANRSLLATAIALLPALADGARAQQLVREHEGPLAAFEEFGWAVSALKDVNGDGRDEYAASGPFGNGNAGVVKVYSGIDGATLATFSGASGSYYGWSLADGGDVDGDGVHDLLIGRPGSPTYDSDAGAVIVVSGADWTTIVTVNGSKGDRLGWSVTGFDDVDLDGLADFAAGAPGWYSERGSIRAYDVAGQQLFRVDGTQIGAQFGWSIGNAGVAVVPDNWHDLIVGEPFWDDRGGGGDRGRAHVLSGQDGTTLWTWEGEAAGDQFGTAVDGVGYVAGAVGAHAVIVGAPRNDWNGSDAGMARIFDTVTGNSIGTKRGDDAKDLLGYAVRGFKVDAGDDGYDDYVIGAPSDSSDGEPGLVRLYSGSLTPVEIGNPSDNCDPHKFFGAALAGPDVTGDGRPDLVVGMPGDFWGCDIRGSAWVFWLLSDVCDTYGAGWPGTNGFPALKCTAGPVIGRTVSLQIGNSAGITTTAVLLVGLDETDLPTGAGGHLLVKDVIFAPAFTVAPDGHGVKEDVPDDPTIAGFTLYTQVLELDPGASKGISFSEGLELVCGWDF